MKLRYRQALLAALFSISISMPATGANAGKSTTLNNPFPEKIEPLKSTSHVAEKPGSELQLYRRRNVPGEAQFLAGNAHAREGRWPEAQQCFFQSLQENPEHPDILLNHAISLDHLGMAEAAVPYYRLALNAAYSKPAAFLPEIVQQRLAELTTAR